LFALQLEAERDEEGHRVSEVLDDDSHVVHPLDRHLLDVSLVGRTP
jgi:hypothetical protein